MDRDQTTLLDIANAAKLVSKFIHDFKKNEFLSEHRTQSAVLCQLIVIGEAVKRLSKKFRDQFPDIPGHSLPGCETILFTAMILWIGMKFGKLPQVMSLNCLQN
jgi:uncharacterized protein with HEPN domain